jgi:hypothetical protein
MDRHAFYTGNLGRYGKFTSTFSMCSSLGQAGPQERGMSALLLRHKLKKIPKYRTKSRATMKNLGLGVVHVTVGPAQGSKAGMGCATGQPDERREEVV